VFVQYEKFKNDDIVAVIKHKAKGDNYTCEVGTRERAQLPKFAFEGATKRYRPDLQVKCKKSIAVQSNRLVVR